MRITSFVFLLVSCFKCVLVEEICHKDLRALANSQKDFVQCSTMHSVPVGLCIGCNSKYEDMTNAYTNLRSIQNCSDKFFDKDRINIVSTTQSILVGLWTRAYCNDCVNTTNSEIFNKKSSTFEECLNLNKKRVCVMCLEEYLDLNTFYINLDQRNNGKVCYDLQDSMNRTRAKWSKEFGCCQREFNMFFFLISSGIIALLPLVFYGGLFAWGKRRELHHGLLNEVPEFPPELPTSSISTHAGSDIVPLSSVTEEQALQEEDRNKIHYSTDSESDEHSDESPMKFKNQ